jgi:hypothetical protein
MLMGKWSLQMNMLARTLADNDIMDFWGYGI